MTTTCLKKVYTCIAEKWLLWSVFDDDEVLNEHKHPVFVQNNLKKIPVNLWVFLEKREEIYLPVFWRENCYEINIAHYTVLSMLK